ncbi:PqqD family protein [Glycomyces artemisiae]|uniref:Coenzyme PQQ synthesis protein D (PqqD) n=1 Tax=Glycomyces artemisiae TaxID=1076443 RepID=A0A2T0ULA6_9ACTN|nr:PqqD family protein [Glycomyces artemisiae]PRY58638.1 coenzyme PQQ synthesis protein D (PqqD) [Glycomyces artemisiae]
MGSLTPESRPLRVDDVVYFPHDGEVLLHHLDSGQYYRLNAVAGEVWELCEGTLSIADIADRIVEAFEADAEQVVKDVNSLIQELHDEECVVLA